MRSRGNHLNNKFDYLFLLKTNKKINEFVLQETEVADVKYFSIDEIREICQNKDKYDLQFTGIFFEKYFWEILENLENRN